ncbi:hypothetical protein AAL_04804 [Moelleriella libera RCEF 2490]|uniref:Uncharacterized protein n=1 Tax=Moelleriella libera RCEF 2490 TaxID=1081109 RepID=A0A162IKA8_9HYPO|nr:hypothetical protein AAL_04804 [Moelleriella libera RCEF 2490]
MASKQAFNAMYHLQQYAGSYNGQMNTNKSAQPAWSDTSAPYDWNGTPQDSQRGNSPPLAAWEEFAQPSENSATSSWTEQGSQSDGVGNKDTPDQGEWGWPIGKTNGPDNGEANENPKLDRPAQPAREHEEPGEESIEAHDQLSRRRDQVMKLGKVMGTGAVAPGSPDTPWSFVDSRILDLLRFHVSDTVLAAQAMGLGMEGLKKLTFTRKEGLTIKGLKPTTEIQAMSQEDFRQYYQATHRTIFEKEVKPRLECQAQVILNSLEAAGKQKHPAAHIKVYHESFSIFFADLQGKLWMPCESTDLLQDMLINMTEAAMETFRDEDKVLVLRKLLSLQKPASITEWSSWTQRDVAAVRSAMIKLAGHSPVAWDYPACPVARLQAFDVQGCFALDTLEHTLQRAFGIEKDTAARTLETQIAALQAYVKYRYPAGLATLVFDGLKILKSMGFEDLMCRNGKESIADTWKLTIAPRMEYTSS